MLSLPNFRGQSGALFQFSARFFWLLCCWVFISGFAQAQQPEVAVRFANPQYNCETGEYCLDVEFQSDREGQEVFGMNVRFFYDDQTLELLDFRDFQGGYAPFLPNPAVRNTGSAVSGSALFNLPSGHPAEFINGAIILDNPQASPILLPTNDWAKLFQMCFLVTDPDIDPAAFCPTVIWDLEAPSNGGFLLGDDGVVITVVDQSGRFDSQPTHERVVHHNWNYAGPGRPPFGTPESVSCVRTSCENPELLITKSTTTTSFSAVGDIINYQLHLENTGDVALNTIRIQDDNADPASISYLMGDNGNGILDPAEVWVYGARHTVIQEDVDAGAVWNIASASGLDSYGDPVTAVSNEIMVPAIQDPTILLTKEGTLNLGLDGIATPGDLITYTFTIENNGNATLTDVVLSDPLPGISLGSMSDLAGDGIAVMAPGAVETVYATYAITQEDIDAGVRDNTATVAGATYGGQIVSDEDSHREMIPVRPVEYCTFTQGFYGNPGGIQDGRTTIEIIEAALAQGPLVIGVPGRSLTFDLEAAQCIIDRLPGNGAPQALPTNLGDITLDAADCSLGSMATDAVGRIRNNFLTQTITLMLNVRYDEDLCSLPLQEICGIQVSNAISGKLGSTATVCDLISCANEVLGGSNTCKLKAAELTDLIGQINERFDECRPLSCGQEPVAGMSVMKSNYFLDEDESGDLSVGDVVIYSYLVRNTGEVTITNIRVVDDLLGPVTMSSSSLIPGAGSVGELQYTIQPEDVGTTIVNVATAYCDQTGPQTDTNSLWVPVPPMNAAIAIEKSTEATRFSAVGEVINYILIIRNTGDLALEAVQLEDPNADPLSLSCPATVLEPGARMFCSASHTVTPEDLDAGQVTNIATVSALAPDGEVLHAQSNEVVVPFLGEAAAALELEKTGVLINCEPGQIRPGDQISYQFTVRNTGDVALRDIIVYDDGIDVGSMNCESFSLAPGESFICGALYTLLQEDIDRGSVQNIATVRGLDPDGNQLSDASDDPQIPNNEDPDGDGEPDDPTVTLLGQESGLELIKTSNHTTFTAVGEQIEYRLIVRNSGNVTLSDLIVEDVQVDAGSLDCFGPILAPGELMICTAIHTVTQSDLDAGEVVNIALVSGMDPNGEMIEAESNEVLIPRAEGCTPEVFAAGCVDMSLAGKIPSGEGLTKICVDVQVHCKQALSNIAFDVQRQASQPVNGSVVTGQSGATYQVQNPTNQPYKGGLKFEAINTELSNGGSDQFCFSLPTAVAEAITAINVTAKVGKQSYKTAVSLTGCVGGMATTIAGRLFRDVDGDGCHGELESGVAEAPVILYNENLQAIASTLTRADGTYRFQGMTAGNYQIRVLNPWSTYHFTEPDFETCNELQNGNVDRSGWSSIFSLAEGSLVDHLDAGIWESTLTPCEEEEMAAMSGTASDTYTPFTPVQIDEKGVVTDAINSAVATLTQPAGTPEFEVYQNLPNPFRESTVITFVIPEAGTVRLRVFDASGRVLRSVEEDFPQGTNEIVLRRSELARTGVLYYTLINGKYSATRKMVVVE